MTHPSHGETAFVSPQGWFGYFWKCRRNGTARGFFIMVVLALAILFAGFTSPLDSIVLQVHFKGKPYLVISDRYLSRRENDGGMCQRLTRF